MNHGSIDTEYGANPSSPYGIGLGNGVPSPYQQGNINSSSSAGLQSQSSDLNTSMHSMNFNGNSGSFIPKAEEKVRNNLPVKYRIAWNKGTSAFTITLLVPKHGQTLDGKVKTKSPFQLVDDGQKNDTGKETHMLRIPLSYLVNLSNQSSTTQQQQAAPWLDRSTLRGRLNDGGKSVGLETPQIYQVIAAVEESATRIAEWAPALTEAVSVDVLLSDGIVSLVAKVSPISIYPPSRSQSFHGSDTYTVLNESSGSLVATAPSFTGESSLSRSFPGQNDTSYSMRDASRNGQQGFRSSSSFTGSSTDNSIFGSSPKGTLNSSFSPWEAEQGAGAGAGQSRREFAQELLSQKTLGMENEFEQKMNPYNASPQPVNVPSSNHARSQPVNANQLFPTPAGELNRSISSGNSPIARQVQAQRRPDPSTIAEPLLAMGFSRAQCDVAIAAIRNLSLTEGTPGRSNNELEQRTRSQSSASLGGSNHEGFNQIQQPQRQHQRQVSGEDILGYVLNSGNSANTFERNMASAIAAENFNTRIGNAPRDSLSAGSVSMQSDETSEKESNSRENASWSSSGDQIPAPQQTGPVWGNAGKLKLVKSSGTGSPTPNQEYPSEVSSGVDGKTSDSNSENEANGNGASPSQKLVKVLDIPSDMNAFVFHCNSHTREECLERGLFGLVPCSCFFSIVAFLPNFVFFICK